VAPDVAREEQPMTVNDLPPIVQRLESEIFSLERELELSRQDAEQHCARADEAERQRDHMAHDLAKCRARLAVYENAPSVEPAPADGCLADSALARQLSQELIEAMDRNQKAAATPTVAKPKSR
ncbi:MAG TPA: hypothetical protein VFE62_06395, partial [Gemmataceae bacterium]|nr:hypothetical protein [Gemmataceae bacterium]